MPRRRISVFSNGLRKLCLNMMSKRGDHAARRVDLVTQRRRDRRAFGDVEIHARAEANEAKTLASGEAVALSNIAENTPRDQACNLYAGHIGPSRGAQPQRVALVLQGSLIESGVDEAPGMVPAPLHTAVHGRAVGMYVEDIHKHADLDGLTLEVGIAGPLHCDDSSVGWRDHGVRVAGHLPRRIAKKLQHEKHRKPDRSRPPADHPAR